MQSSELVELCDGGQDCSLARSYRARNVRRPCRRWIPINDTDHEGGCRCRRWREGLDDLGRLLEIDELQPVLTTRYRDRDRYRSGSIEHEMDVNLVEYRTRDRGRQRITYPASMAYLPVWSGTAEWAASANATSMSRKMLCDAPLDVDVDVDAAITQISLG